MHRLLASVLGSVALAGCAADVSLPVEEAEPSGTIAQAVIGGTPAQPCQWPSTVRIEGGCTGTLIHPRVVTTAAHCLARASVSVSFGEIGAAGTFSLTARCVAGARGAAGANTAKDWAYCVLPEDARLDAIPFTPPLVGCEAKLIGPGTKAWVVGYGATTPRGNVGPKRQVEVQVNALDKVAPGTIDVGDRSVGACHGDSGGPLYVHLEKDGRDFGVRVAGSTSGAGSAFFCDCTCSTTYIAIENHVRALEKNEGIDVTPCTDADGKWDPGPGCRELPSAPEDGTGTYPAACVVAKTTQPIESCGPAAADAGVHDAGQPDASATSDAGLADAGAPDGSRPDASEPDVASSDAGRVRADAGAGVDAGRDAGKRDASLNDRLDDEDDGSGDVYAKSEGGCATARTSPSGELLLALLALFARRRRVPQGRSLVAAGST